MQHWIKDDIEYLRSKTVRQTMDRLPWLSRASDARRRLGFVDNFYRIRVDFMLSRLNRMGWLDEMDPST
jgi:hypothetical protein